ncbi:NUDIX hydrolase [Gehongia tenuis]|uniref:NUDIX domain-containing protein n=1 Tax=Gehongia tenuis TaxID=2763655 RepID=A0A926D584_9FIRM|nr:NUDIX domain-containing protein [Gehongia tenuis]MBC8531841.1 NUDIX domain-containing protein [Gehongia tenuis]
MKLLAFIADGSEETVQVFTPSELPVHWISPFHPRLTARAVLLKDREVALMHMDKLGIYTLPGGGLMERETPCSALHREVLEETGYPCTILKELGRIDEQRRRYHSAQRSYGFLAEVNGAASKPQMTLQEQKSNTHLEWHSPAEALYLLKYGHQAKNPYWASFIETRERIFLQHALELL